MPKIAAKDSNKNVTIAPHGTGKVVVGTGAADATVQSDGDHNLILQTGNSTTSKIEITDGANGDVAVSPNGTGNLTIDNIAISDNAITSTDTNGNIAITPNGTGEVDISKVDIDGGAVDGVTLGTNSAVTEAQIDNINIDGNAITSTNTNGNIDLTPAGTGEVNISKVDIDGGAIDGTNVTVGSGKTLDVSAGSLTTSTAQKQAIVDGADITSVGTVTSGTISTGAVIDDPTMTQGSDATGDVYYRAASGKLTRLATGADGTILTSTGVGAVPAFEAAAGLPLVKISSTTITTPASPIEITSSVDYDTYFGMYTGILVSGHGTQIDYSLRLTTYTSSSVHTWTASLTPFGMVAGAVRAVESTVESAAWVSFTPTTLDADPLTNRLITGYFWIYGATEIDSFLVGDCWANCPSPSPLAPPVAFRHYGRKATSGNINKVGWQMNQGGDLVGTFSLYGMEG
jgi:hypothetical protein